MRRRGQGHYTPVYPPPGALQAPGIRWRGTIEDSGVVLAAILRQGWQPGVGVAVPEPVARHQVCLRSGRSLRVVGLVMYALSGELRARCGRCDVRVSPPTLLIGSIGLKAMLPHGDRLHHT